MLLHFDGFQTYQNGTDLELCFNDLITSYTNNGAANFNCSSSYARFGEKGMGNSYADNYIQWNLSQNFTTFIFGMAYKVNGVPAYNASYPTLSFYDGATIQLKIDFDGSELTVRRGDGTLLGTTSGANITLNTWRYIQVKFTIDNSAGAVEIRSDKNTVLTLTGVDTQNTANAYFNAIRIRRPYLSGLTSGYFADMYWCDTTGPDNNDFLGDVRADVLRVNAAGTYTQLTPSAGDNYQNVDEDYPDDDTTYNEATAEGQKDSYGLESLPSPPANTKIFGIKSQITVRKTDVGLCEAEMITIAGTTEHLSDPIVLDASYKTIMEILENNPDDSAAWEDADVNALEIGIETTVLTTTTTTTTSTTTTTV